MINPMMAPPTAKKSVGLAVILDAPFLPDSRTFLTDPGVYMFWQPFRKTKGGVNRIVLREELKGANGLNYHFQ